MEPIKDINDLVISLEIAAASPLFDDEMWMAYGYRKRPKRGGLVRSLLPNDKLEDIVEEELLTMGFIDVFCSINESTVPTETKLLLSLGVIDVFLANASKRFLNRCSFVENLFDAWDIYVKRDRSEMPEPFAGSHAIKAKNHLSSQAWARYLLCTMTLLRAGEDKLLLNSVYIKEIIENASFENTVNFSLSDGVIREYRALLAKRLS